jgi:hypothetical protein
MSIRNTFTKVASVFVERPQQNRPVPDPNTPSQDGLLSGVTHLLGLSVGDARGTRTSVATVPDVPLDLSAIYRRFSVPVAPFSAEQALDLIEAVPQGVDRATRKRMACGMLNALTRSAGVVPRDVATDASAKIAALNEHVKELAQQTDSLIQRAEAEIQSLQGQIEQKRQTIVDERAKSGLLARKCQEESRRLGSVVEYFGDGTS